MSESQNIEYKQSWHDDYLKWICGFANAIGGVIYIGKNNDGEVIHLQDFSKLLEDIPSKVRNSMGIICDVQLHDVNGKKYISININPYSVPVSLRGRYYYRSGSSNMELTGIELNEFLLKKAGKSWDDVIEEGANIMDIDEISLNKFINDSLEKGRLPETTGISSFQILEKLRLTKDSKLKRASILLFGKDPNRFYPNIQVKIGRFGKDASDLKFHEVIEGNIIQLLDEVQVQLNYKFLTRPVDFEGMQRIEKGEYPVGALREMLLNALVHRTYMGAPIQIRVYDNKLSIWNEGKLPDGLDLESLKKDHNSRPRNPLLADACFKSGYIDAWGRGTLKIISTCLEAGLPEPEIAEKDGGIEIVVYKSNQVGNQVSNQVGNKVIQESRKINYNELIEKISFLIKKPTEKQISKYKEEFEKLEAKDIEILKYCARPKKRKQILEAHLGLSNQSKNFKTHISPLIEKGLIQPTIKERPNSQHQQYVITAKGNVMILIQNQLKE